ncbi:MAG: TolC family outer membrane protein [Arcobacteraceae bacterium]|nr:TolC family outer membrane protein [Arcobacteraceae bacterium]MDY0327325.1 TolC family outer membrane protein [Arcobacteraceae bacterium]
MKFNAKKHLLSVVAASSLGLFSTNVSALTLQESVTEVLNTNPVIVERLKNYRVTQQDLKIAESEYYPRVDLRAVAGYNDPGELKTSRVADINYNNYETALTITQNIFDGFGTMHKVDYQEARILAAGYHYLETANDMAFRMTNAYLNVLRAYELLQTSLENVEIVESLYEKVNILYDGGYTTDSEVQKIKSALSLAKANLTVQKHNTLDAEKAYRRILGRLPEIEVMKKPIVDFEVPESIERAAMVAIKNNPSIMVSHYNIEGAQALHKQRKKEYYPKIDFEVAQHYNDVSRLDNGFDRPDDRLRARVIMTFNLYKGGADKADIQKHLSTIHQEVEIQRDLQRQVVESLDFSWNAYDMIKLQLKDLKEYRGFAEKTLDLYKEEYDMGRRTLLDLLSAQGDVINSRIEIIQAEYEYLFAHYRILDAMGLLVKHLTDDTNTIAQNVNINTNEKAHFIKDTLPIIYDVDNDKIVDSVDLCNNSLSDKDIMPYGCEQDKHDSVQAIKTLNSKQNNKKEGN